MRLIGRLDSPYVRRVAISMRMMGLDFNHEPLSVFRDVEAFAAINPVIKAPTLVTDDGTALIDSTLILMYLDSLVPADRRLQPEAADALLTVQHAVGLALAACEKTVQIVYETQLRPADKQHAPWLDRVRGQAQAAYDLLEQAYRPVDDWLLPDRMTQADITAAVAWRFTNGMLADLLAPDRYPALAALSARAEATPVFQALPFG
ncbi:glutathione S-transferase [Sphingomonas sp. RIT328]|uniref:glutathione S-transferase n=1 Tax=Sphingomonas sp. RIT328 TaxID=1470591 RepID=UPI00044F2CB4|nr:glutathione S-transferase N-terminal domain-containing protein [Sphingomonas sp. RIT328]EZP54679.1 Glutathione S-transferase-like protein [Sphingomonas sp. RIT328]